MGIFSKLFNNTEKIKQRTIEHYERMIEWVKLQDLDDFVDAEKMIDGIEEDWGGCILSLLSKILS